MVRVTKYYEWKKSKSDLKDNRFYGDTIPIQHQSPEHRHTTPDGERVFPEDRDMVEIDVERYILLVRNWGRRLQDELERIKETK